VKARQIRYRDVSLDDWDQSYKCNGYCGRKHITLTAVRKLQRPGSCRWFEHWQAISHYRAWCGALNIACFPQTAVLSPDDSQLPRCSK